MRKILFIITIILVTVSCKNSETKTAEETINTNNTDVIYKGDFIYLTDAAVLKGNEFIYGVKINDKMHELAKKIQPIKETDYDMIPVAVKGTISKKEVGAEGWDEIITITDIVMVGKAPAKVDVKLEDKN